MNPDPILDEDEAAQYLGVLSVRTLQRLRQTGGGPPILKLGRRVGYRASDLDRWANAQRIGSTSEPQP